MSDELDCIRELDRLRQIEAKVHEILSQVGDNICWMDWGRLYPELATLAGVPDWKPSILPVDAMLANCRRFIASLASGEHYEAPVITEEEAAKLRAESEYRQVAIDGLEIQMRAQTREIEGLEAQAKRLTERLKHVESCRDESSRMNAQLCQERDAARKALRLGATAPAAIVQVVRRTCRDTHVFEALADAHAFYDRKTREGFGCHLILARDSTWHPATRPDTAEGKPDA